MILYKKYQLKSGLESAKNKWYARPVVNETLNIEALAKHMSDHNTPFSPGVIRGVLTDMVACIKELILGAESAETFKIGTHVKGVRLRARATGELSNKQLNLEATLREQGVYNVAPSSGGTDTGEEPGGGGMLG